MNLYTDYETRATQNFVRETLAFDNGGAYEFERIENMKQQEKEIKLKSSFLNRQNTNRSSQMENICRICLSDEDQASKHVNPLISPCSCTGSLKFIHLVCLKEWLEGKKHKKETNAVNSYIWKNLECELCKAPYGESHKFSTGKTVSLLNYEVHAEARSYMVIESVTNTTSKTIHVINFNDKPKIKVVILALLYCNREEAKQWRCA